MRIKKGFTLIEIVIVITVIGILNMCFFSYLNTYKVYKGKILVDRYNNSIMTFINSCKQYCYYNNIPGFIKFDIIGNRLIFTVDTVIKRILNTPNEFKLYSINVSNGRSEVWFDNKGFTSDACTISYMDSINKVHAITISVGTSYVEIKN